MTKRNIIIVGVLLVALIAAGALVALAMSGDEPSGPLVYSAGDDGRSIEVKVGESFTVVLEGNPTTGYSWQVEGVDEAILSVGEPDYKSDSDLVGSGGTFTFTFTALSAGESQVRLGYSRPWESVAPLQSFTLNVTAR
ncbi:MAG: hypothetical protein A2Z12_05185 [Actinobacteria bacterium RBG_16_68_21]|nr:MAG: hypothetical protein A2Z12_05185 [Actinobacteria bacterium RBG_16_68_21]